MSSFTALAIMTAVCCGLWSLIADTLGLVAWIGFAGCTTYFACNNKGIVGIKRTIACNLAGVLCAMVTIVIGSMVPSLNNWGICSALITFVMCMLSKVKALDYCPGIFIGCFTTFAVNGNLKIVVPSIVIGGILGLTCEYTGKLFYNLIKNIEKNKHRDLSPLEK